MPTLDFEGKEIVHSYHLAVPHRPLLPDAAKSLHPAGDGDNLIIQGDNLHALKALLPRYAGRVKCIYIDPPYNTGNEGWAYNDNVNSPLMKGWLNQVVGRDDQSRHDKWLCMMWPRLQLLRELLADDGAIFVSIDDNEQHHLRMLLNEIFGAENFIAEIPWESGSPKNDTDISVQHEYIIGYAKVRRQKDRRLKQSNYERWFNQPDFAIRPEPLSADGFSNPDNDPRGAWKLQTFHAPNIRPNLTYPIVNPETKEEHWPPSGRCWRMTQEQFQGMMNDNRIIFGKAGTSMPQLKVFYETMRHFGVTPQSWWSGPKYSNSSGGTTEVREVFPQGQHFPYPKPSQLIKHLAKLATGPEDIILDSFAGSGTTAHAVLALNKEDGGNRKFILVECEGYADSITAERVRRVINGVPGAKDESLRKGLGGSFTYHTLGDPIEVEGMLSESALPEFGALAAYLLYTAGGISADAASIRRQNASGLFYTTGQRDYYLIYEPSGDWLRGNDAVLNRERAEAISAASKGQDQDKEAIVYAACKYISQRALSELGIRFIQIPYGIHQSV